jgi:predicted O-methyltransferase YrrM
MMLNKWIALLKSSRIEGWLMPGEPGYLYDLADKYIPVGGLAAEVGSWKGKSTIMIATACRELSAKLLSIDTFSGNIEITTDVTKNTGVYAEAHQNPDEFWQNNIVKNLSDLPVEYLKMTSKQATRKIKNQSLDFCFLDGDHTVPVVYQDIHDYLPKVKKGGILLGHDYSLEPNPKNQVKASVDKIIGAKNITLFQSIWLYQVK